MEQPQPRTLRADEQTLGKYLNLLDQRARPTPPFDLRASERFAYRTETLTLEIARGDGARMGQQVAPRNVGAGGIGILAGQYIYPGTTCRLTLRSLHGYTAVAEGRVVRSRYMEGSGQLYDTGIAFTRPIDVALFARMAKCFRVLVLEQSQRIHELIKRLAEPMNVDLLCTTDALDAMSAAMEHGFDLVLLDLDSNLFDSYQVARELREAGYLGAIVGMAVRTGQATRDRCVGAGCTGYLNKPLTREALHHLIESLRTEPLLSTLANDMALAPLINEFVKSLPAFARQIALAFEQGDVELVRRLAQELRADAGSYGFEPLSDEAKHLQSLAAMGSSMVRLRPAVYDLIHLCLAARPAPTT